MQAMTDQQVLDRFKEVLETELGKSADNFNWQEYWDMSDQDFEQIRIFLGRLTLADTTSKRKQEDSNNDLDS